MAFDTSVLERARARQRVRLERERLATLSQLLRLLEEHGTALGISEADVFGSLIHPGRFRDDSDVDVAVPRVEAESFFAAMSILSTALGREVDLVDLTMCHFARQIRERAIRWMRTS